MLGKLGVMSNGTFSSFIQVPNDKSEISVLLMLSLHSAESAVSHRITSK